MKDNWSSAHFCSICTREKGSNLKLIDNVHTAFLLCGENNIKIKRIQGYFEQNSSNWAVMQVRSLIILFFSTLND